jgi:hypothetical protein
MQPSADGRYVAMCQGAERLHQRIRPSSSSVSRADGTAIKPFSRRLPRQLIPRREDGTAALLPSPLAPSAPASATLALQQLGALWGREGARLHLAGELSDPQARHGPAGRRHHPRLLGDVAVTSATWLRNVHLGLSRKTHRSCIGGPSCPDPRRGRAELEGRRHAVTRRPARRPGAPRTRPYASTRPALSPGTGLPPRGTLCLTRFQSF